MTSSARSRSAGIALSVICPNADFGSCPCVDGVRNVASDSVTRDQYLSCAAVPTDALVNQFSAATCLIAN